jgi:hypothetical protein
MVRVEPATAPNFSTECSVRVEFEKPIAPLIMKTISKYHPGKAEGLSLGAARSG